MIVQCPDCGREDPVAVQLIHSLKFMQGARRPAVGPASLRCHDCFRAHERAAKELIARYRDEFELIRVCMFARTAPLGEALR